VGDVRKLTVWEKSAGRSRNRDNPSPNADRGALVNAATLGVNQTAFWRL
jgi:hypothetical protein